MVHKTYGEILEARFVLLLSVNFVEVDLIAFEVLSEVCARFRKKLSG